MDSPDKYKSTLAFVDLLFNILLGFVFLFVVAFLLINPVAKRADIEQPAQYMITMTWPDHSKDDIDLWVKDPVGNTVFFMTREAGFLSLDRDDLGIINDSVIVNGQPVEVELNREVVTVRGIVPGPYLVSAHYYRLRSELVEDIPVTIEVVRLRPYTVVYKQTKTMRQQSEIKNFYQFTIHNDGSFGEVVEPSGSAVSIESKP
jgi:hypothetical protein